MLAGVCRTPGSTQHRPDQLRWPGCVLLAFASRMPSVKHLPPGVGNLDASLFFAHPNPIGPTERHIDAGDCANSGRAQHGLSGLRDCSGSVWRPHFGRSSWLTLNTLARSKSGLDHRNCTAIPPCDSVRKGKNVQGARPRHALLREYSPKKAETVCTAGLKLRWTNSHSHATLATHPPLSALV